MGVYVIWKYPTLEEAMLEPDAILVKIGFSSDSNAEKRLKSVRTGNPYKLVVAAWDPEGDRNCETALRKFFPASEADNDWCSCYGEYKLEILNLVKACAAGETSLLSYVRRKWEERLNAIRLLVPELELGEAVIFPKSSGKCVPITGIRIALTGSNYYRRCPACGGPQLLQLRQTVPDGIVRDQPRCCRSSKNGEPEENE